MNTVKLNSPTDAVSGSSQNVRNYTVNTMLTGSDVVSVSTTNDVGAYKYGRRPHTGGGYGSGVTIHDHAVGTCAGCTKK